MQKIESDTKGRRKFIREKRRSLKTAKKALKELRFGCAVDDLFDGTRDFYHASCRMQAAIDEMDRITKPLA